MNPLVKFFNDFKGVLYRKYGENPGKMLVHTGVLGWILSSLAQITGIAFNDKLSAKEKAFLIPQEIGDAAVNIFSFYVVTSSIKKLASKLVTTGKWTTGPIKELLKKDGFYKEAKGPGNIKFNIENLPHFERDIKPKYQPFKNGVDVVASTIGGVLSCNILTPLLRNEFAARRQKKTLAQQNLNQPELRAPKGISIDDYRTMASMKPCNLKI